MADQGVSSLSNVVVSIFVARSLSSDGFGAFSLATVVYLLAQGTTRALIGEPLLSRFSSADAATRRSLVPNLVGATLATSFVGAAVVVVVGLAVGGPAAPALLALALVLPLVLVQDTWRYVFIVDRAGSALAVDLVWLVTVIAALSLAPDDAGAAWFVLAWGATAGLGALTGLVLGRGSLGRPRPLAWITAHRDMGGRFLGEFATGQAVGQLVLVALGAIAGLSALGAVRAAQVVYGPLNTVHQGIYLALVPEGARTTDESHLRRLMAKASVGLVVVATVWMLVVLVMPNRWGTALFSATWSDADDLMLLMGLAMIAGSAATGGFAGVRALGAARESLRARLRSVGPQLVLPLAGTAVGAGHGYALGFGLGHLVSAVIWWGAFGAALSARRQVGVELSGDRHSAVRGASTLPPQSAPSPEGRSIA
jgi:O-antigen/teichoic acid export membrane protein